MHDQLFSHVGLNQFDELFEEYEFVLLALFNIITTLVIFLDQEMQETDHMVLIKLEAQLILALAKKELDEGILADDWVLALLLLVVDWDEIGHHEFC